MGLQAFLLRQAMGRLRITDDIVRHLSTFQRLGEKVEVQLPTELLPVGARTVFRAVRTRAAAQLGVDWVWPYWLERQLDPRSPAFVPRGHLPVTTNMTARNWTGVSPPHSPHKAIVDPRGLVTPWFDGWSLDWWVRAGGGWHLPSRAADVRQGLVGGAPVVETAMRVPGGEAVERVYAVAGGNDPTAVVEVANDTAEPLTLALAVRPYNPEGLAVIEHIEVRDRTVIVDGRAGLVLPRAPAAVAASNFLEGDSAVAVLAGRTGALFPPALRCDAGLAQAAFLFPIEPGERLRAAIPLVPLRRTRRKGVARQRAYRAPQVAGTLPSANEVAARWQAVSDRRMRLRLPPGPLAEAVDANRRYLLVFHDGDDVTPGPFTYHRFWFRDAAYLLSAMDRYGLHPEVAQVLRSYPRRQHLDGFYFSQRQEWDSNGTALWALAEHWRLTRDTSCIDAPSIGKAVRWIERKRNTRRRKDPSLKGLMPASISAEHLGPFDYFYWDDFWSLRGLLDGALLLRLAGADEEAEEAERWADGLRRDLAASMALVARRLQTDIVPAGPRRRIDPAIIGSLVACWPLGLVAADDPAMAATAAAVRERFCIGPAFFQAISHTGLGTYLTLQLAEVELAAGDRRALGRLEWLVGAATPTFTWPEAIHPRLGGGCMGDGHHGWAAADFLTLVRNLLVRDLWVDGQPELALCSMLPDAWVGEDIEVAGAPTHAGTLSFTLRWDADHAILRWDLRPHPDLGPVRLSAPGLDPSWASKELSGEARLPVVEGAATPPG
jgi:hypothetical protein